MRRVASAKKEEAGNEREIYSGQERGKNRQGRKTGLKLFLEIFFENFYKGRILRVKIEL